VVTVSALHYYPVKGCAGVSVGRAQITEAGLAHDRRFMFVKPDGTFRCQRTTQALATIRPTVVHDGTKLILAASGHSDLTFDVRLDGPRKPVVLHKIWPLEGIDQGDDVADWASEVLGQPVRLVRTTPDFDRQVDEHHGQVGFADSTALHATSVASLDDLNARILERGAEPVPMERFRPNLVLAGVEPYGEDTLTSLTIGDAVLRYVKPDIRCRVTMTDQVTGEMVGPEPIRTLAGYRRELDGVSFGIKLAVERPGTVSVGDTVY
jgi:uncharacterized protein YcbX